MASEYSLVAPLIGVAAAEALKPVKKLVSYCAEAGNNVQNLEDAAENLIFIIDTVQINIESGQAQGRIISPEAEGWMARASVLASEVDAIMIRYAGRRVRLLGYSLNFWSIYSISKDAFLKQNDIKEHQNNRPNNDELFVQIPSLEPQVAVQELYFVDCILQVVAIN